MNVTLTIIFCSPYVRHFTWLICDFKGFDEGLTFVCHVNCKNKKGAPKKKNQTQQTERVVRLSMVGTVEQGS